jgi:hypothetical protein
MRKEAGLTSDGARAAAPKALGPAPPVDWPGVVRDYDPRPRRRVGVRQPKRNFGLRLRQLGVCPLEDLFVDLLSRERAGTHPRSPFGVGAPGSTWSRPFPKRPCNSPFSRPSGVGLALSAAGPCRDGNGLDSLCYAVTRQTELIILLSFGQRWTGRRFRSDSDNQGTMDDSSLVDSSVAYFDRYLIGWGARKLPLVAIVIPHFSDGVIW